MLLPPDEGGAPTRFTRGCWGNEEGFPGTPRCSFKNVHSIMRGPLSTHAAGCRRRVLTRAQPPRRRVRGVAVGSALTCANRTHAGGVSGDDNAAEQPSLTAQ